MHAGLTHALGTLVLPKCYVKTQIILVRLHGNVEASTKVVVARPLQYHDY
jgi:hypothetical protein